MPDSNPPAVPQVDPGTVGHALDVLTAATASDAVKLALILAVAAVVLLLVWTRRPQATDTNSAADALRIAAGAIAEVAQQVQQLAADVRDVTAEVRAVVAEVRDLRAEVHRLTGSPNTRT